MENQEWRWNRGIWPFVEVVQWAFVFNKLVKEGNPETFDIMSDPEKVIQKAEEYGMTVQAIVHEMLRIGEDARDMFVAIDERKHCEQETGKLRDEE